MGDDLNTVLRDNERLDALFRLQLLDGPAEEPFDRLTRLAARVLNVPVSLVSLVDDHRQFFKSACGLPEPWASRRETPLSHSFCQHVVVSGEPLVIEDARDHPLVRNNLAVRDLDVVAYLGMPLTTPGGHTVGSFCVIDARPRRWSESDQETMRELAASVMSEMALSLANRDMEQQVRARTAELRAANEALKEIEVRQRRLIAELDHRVKNVLARVCSVATFTRHGATSMDGFVETLEGRIQSLADSHHLLSSSSWQGVALSQLIENQLSPYVATDRTVIEGPGIVLTADAIQALAPLFHELVTNAAKYGALKVTSGRVSVSWRITEPESDGPADRHLVVHWQETGGPVVEAPKRVGFGTRMIRELVKHELAGTADLVFDAQGVDCTLTMPLANVSTSA